MNGTSSKATYLGCMLQVMCLSIFAALSFAHANESAKRWAVIGTEEVQESGLTDLLIVRLSDQTSIELVERDQLDLATKELELSTLYGSKASGLRAKLGQLVKADVLALLSTVEHNNKRFVRVVISDTRYGARLRTENLLRRDDEIEPLVGQLERCMLETREHFSEGIRHLLCVPDFLSKNLTHDYDNLQSGYAALLADSIGTYPGVAIVEIEEARTIAKELALGSQPLKRQVVPLFVEGEFEMSTTKPNSEPSVHLALRISDGKQIRSKSQQANLTMSEVTDLLTDRFPKHILQLAEDESGTPISRKQQSEKLAARAKAFSELGIWQQSTALREAVLLIDPDATEQHFRLIKDYYDSLRFDRRELAKLRHQLRKDATLRGREREVYERSFSVFQILASHIENVVRRQKANPREAAQLLSRVGRMGPSMRGTEIREALDRFFWSVAPHILRLDGRLRNGTIDSTLRFGSVSAGGNPITVQEQYQKAAGEAISMIVDVLPVLVTRRGSRTLDDRETLDNLYRFLTDYATETIPVTRMAYLITENGAQNFNWMLTEGRISAGQLQSFYNRLRASSNPANVFYSRFGQLALDATTGSVSSDTLKEVDSLLKMVKDRQDWKLAELIFTESLGKLRSDIVDLLGTPSQRLQRNIPIQLPEFDPSPRLVFSPVDAVQADWFGWLQCGKTMDAMWSRNTLYVMRQKGITEKAYSLKDSNDSILSAVWDGKNFWIGTKISGIVIVSPLGKMLGRINAEQGLPPYENRGEPRRWHGYSNFEFRSPLHLHPIAPGRCLVIGQMKDTRVWFAEISQTKSGSKFQANVIHAATQTIKAYNAAQDNDPKVAFYVSWLNGYTHPKHPNSRWCLVGRLTSGIEGRRPLAVDLTTHEATVFGPMLPRGSFVRYSKDGRLFWVTDSGVGAHWPEGLPSSSNWKSKTLFNRTARTKADRILTPYELKFQLLEHDGHLLVPGTRWYQVDPNTLEVEQVTRARIPYQNIYRYYSNSAHYGMIAWNVGDRVYQISLRDRSTDHVIDDLSIRYPYVPESLRTKHHQAVQIIRKHGGRVDAAWGTPVHQLRHLLGNYRSASTYNPGWRTFVYLPAEWSGGDKELSHLRDLYNLRAVFLVQANVSNDGMKHIGALDLETLHLTETKATNEGLANLKGMTRLKHLRLEGAGDGRTFGDQGLSHLTGIEQLNELELYGPGFTDASLHHLKQQGLRTLWILKTAITQNGISELNKSRSINLSVKHGLWRVKEQ